MRVYRASLLEKLRRVVWLLWLFILLLYIGICIIWWLIESWELNCCHNAVLNFGLYSWCWLSQTHILLEVRKACALLVFLIVISHRIVKSSIIFILLNLNFWIVLLFINIASYLTFYDTSSRSFIDRFRVYWACSHWLIVIRTRPADQIVIVISLQEAIFISSTLLLLFLIALHFFIKTALVVELKQNFVNMISKSRINEVF